MAVSGVAQRASTGRACSHGQANEHNNAPGALLFLLFPLPVTRRVCSQRLVRSCPGAHAWGRTCPHDPCLQQGGQGALTWRVWSAVPVQGPRSGARVPCADSPNPPMRLLPARRGAPRRAATRSDDSDGRYKTNASLRARGWVPTRHVTPSPGGTFHFIMMKMSWRWPGQSTLNTKEIEVLNNIQVRRGSRARAQRFSCACSPARRVAFSPLRCYSPRASSALAAWLAWQLAFLARTRTSTLARSPARSLACAFGSLSHLSLPSFPPSHLFLSPLSHTHSPSHAHTCSPSSSVPSPLSPTIGHVCRMLWRRLRAA